MAQRHKNRKEQRHEANIATAVVKSEPVRTRSILSDGVSMDYRIMSVHLKRRSFILAEKY